VRTIQEAVLGYRRLTNPVHGEIILLRMQNGTYLQVPCGGGSKKPLVFFAAEEHTSGSDHSKRQGSALGKAGATQGADTAEQAADVEEEATGYEAAAVEEVADTDAVAAGEEDNAVGEPPAGEPHHAAGPHQANATANGFQALDERDKEEE